MPSRFVAFLRAESGAITVDWVVLTAACTAIAIGAFWLIATISGDTTQETTTIIAGYEIDNQFDTVGEAEALFDAARGATTGTE